jgi:hypothetical protein
MNVRGAPTLGAAPVLALLGAGTRHVPAARRHAAPQSLEQDTPVVDTCPCSLMGLESLELTRRIYRKPSHPRGSAAKAEPCGVVRSPVIAGVHPAAAGRRTTVHFVPQANMQVREERN